MRSLWLPGREAYIRFHDLPGEPPTCVFLHGLGSSAAADFPHVTRHPALARRRSVLIDFLGFGFSDRPREFGYTLEEHAHTAAAVLDHLGIEGACVVGHSMGGTVAIALAALRPELVSRLILAEPNLDPGVGGGSKIIASYGEGEFIGAWPEYLARAKLASETEPELTGYLGALALADPLAMHRSSVGLLRGTRPPQRELLAGMGMPRALLIGGRSEEDFGVESLRAIGVGIFVVPGAGHGMMDDNPDGFAAAVAAALPK